MNPSSGSSVAAARAALFDLLAATAPDATAQHATSPRRKVQVVFGVPSHEEMEVVALLGVVSPREDVESLGAMRRDEEYDIEVGVKAHDPTAGDDAESRKAHELRGYELVEWVRSTVHGHYTLNDTVRTAFVTGGGEYGGVQRLDKAGLVAFHLLTIHCEADIIDAGAAP